MPASYENCFDYKENNDNNGQIETITCADCPYCGYKILATWHTEKNLSGIETYERQQRALNDHIKLHEESKKYHWLCDHVRRMAEITGDSEHDA